MEHEKPAKPAHGKQVKVAALRLNGNLVETDEAGRAGMCVRGNKCHVSHTQTASPVTHSLPSHTQPPQSQRQPPHPHTDTLPSHATASAAGGPCLPHYLLQRAEGGSAPWLLPTAQRGHAETQKRRTRPNPLHQLRQKICQRHGLLNVFTRGSTGLHFNTIARACSRAPYKLSFKT